MVAEAPGANRALTANFGEPPIIPPPQAATPQLQSAG
uniref:Uncharacterized protein n=1 Tax=Anopheles albimanus TaxID=7167 RepID=A0A182FAC1_ANOAL